MVANAQAYWADPRTQMDELTIPFLGPERAAWQYPFRSLLAAGARLAMGSDWSVSTADPLLQMEVAVDAASATSTVASGRRSCPTSGSISTTPSRGSRRGSAWVNHLEAEVGSIEVGKAADLVVLDRDLFDRGAGCDRRGAGRRHVHRRRRRPRGARARGLTRRPAVMDG